MVQDSVDNTASVTDRNTLSGSVPTCIYEVCLCTALLHLLYKLLCILGRMQLEECLAEASRECWSRLCDAALCTCQLGGEAREEVVLGLLMVKNRNRRQYAECVSAQEDNLLCSGTLRFRPLDVLNMIDRIRNTSVLGYALVSEVYLSVLVNCYVFKQSVACDSAVDVGLRLFVKIDNLSIAAAFVVEDALVVPSVLVVADELTFGIGRKGGLTCTRQAEEDSGILALHVSVCRAVHRCNALQWQEIVHH